MKITSKAGALIALTTLAIGMPNASAKPKKSKAAPSIELTAAGKTLEARYASQMESLKSELTKAIPSLRESGKTDYVKSKQAEADAKKALDAAIEQAGELGRAQGLIKHATGKWIGGADKGIAQAREKLKQATTAAQRQAAEAELKKWQDNKQAGLDELVKRQARLKKAQAERPQVEKALQQAEKALVQAKQQTQTALAKLGVTPVLVNDKLDAKLARFVTLMEATPRGLAAFAQQGKRQESLIEQLLADDELLVQMAVADGANQGNYGRAMEIYSDILKASPGAKEKGSILQRLAVAVSLEHASPITQRNALANTDAPATVDPVQRFLSYAKAFINGELDPAFKNLTTWDYRMVVDGEEPDEISAWGRTMLANYRPDQITTKDYRWRYVTAVRTDIRYGSHDNKHDRADLQFFQNILMNGGICGRRAFYGRFILRAFGIPVIARPQRAHAALAHWTPDGWVVCLGGGWGIGWTKTRYERDLDFLANTQARSTGEAFKQVKRAQWIGDLFGEPRVYGMLSKKSPGFWYGISLNTQRAIIAASEAKTLAAVGESLGEANESDEEKEEITEVRLNKQDLEVTIAKDGTITIPAVATTNPTKSTGVIIFMDSRLGGKQMHYSRSSKAQSFEYTVDAPAAGSYSLSAKVVTPSWQQHLLLTLNNADQAVDIPLPHTVGMWDHTEPVTIKLKKGRNVLKFDHKSEGYEKGFSIKEFKLTPTGR